MSGLDNWELMETLLEDKGFQRQILSEGRLFTAGPEGVRGGARGC